VSFRVLTTHEELEAEASRWGVLEEAARSPAQQFAWVRACAAAFEGELRIVVVEDDEAIIAVAPLSERAGALELLGARELFEPGDFLYRDEKALDELARQVARLRKPVVLHRAFADGPAEGALRRAFRRRGLVLRREANQTPVLDLSGTPVEDRFSSRRRGDIRRARRRAEELGAVVAEVLSPRPGEVSPLLEEIVAVEAAGWKGVEGTALAQDPARLRFFEDYAARSAADETLCVARLRIGDEPAAVQLAVEHGRRLWLLKIGYDERFARCSPGTLLMLEVAGWASDKALEAIEFLGVAEEWTRFWTEEVRDCVALHVYPVALSTAKSLAVDAIGHGRRRARRGVEALAARAHVAGPGLDDALAACDDAAAKGRAVTIGYWDAPGDTPALVESISLVAIERLGESGMDAYLSIKPAALGNSLKRIAAILDRADELGVPVHFDSTGPAEAEPAWQLLEALARPSLGCTLPSGWGRSLADAKRAVELGLRVRVVKGQWDDPDFEAHDKRERFLELVDVVADVGYLGVATHDRPLAIAATRRSDRAQHERLLGLPWRGDDLGRTRIYVPFGQAYLPYAIGRARENPRLALWVLRDVIRGSR
jgi:CelD/BcsL family acetyltransferase involved in cellulose biosynthesis